MSSTPTSTVSRLAAHHYTFTSQWTFASDYDAVYEVLSRLGDYAAWWPQITRSEADASAGRAVIHLRAALPMTLKLALERDLEDRDAGNLRANVRGDIAGTISWSIRRRAEGTEVRFDQAVTLEHPIARRIDIGIRPLLQWNHAVAMRGCAAGLRARLISTGAG